MAPAVGAGTNTHTPNKTRGIFLDSGSNPVVCTYVCRNLCTRASSVVRCSDRGLRSYACQLVSSGDPVAVSDTRGLLNLDRVLASDRVSQKHRKLK